MSNRWTTTDFRRAFSLTAVVAAAAFATPAGGLAMGADEPDHHAAPAHAPAKPAAAKAKEPNHAPAHAPAHASTPTKPAAKAPEPKPAANHDEPEVAEAAPAAESTTDADSILAKLSSGNDRWVNGKTKNPHTDSAWRAELAKGQNPFVTVITCADSRLPVERIFDQGAGDVFVVRVAGNVAGGSEVGTIEYGLGHLKTPVLVVMGHTKCGAVAAAAANADVHGKLAELVDRVKPGVERARRMNPGASDEQIVPLAIKENVWQTVFDVMKDSSEIRTMVENGEVRIVGAVCDISTGKVEWMGEHPWQTELLASLNAAAGTDRHAAAEGE